jgi:hypothetical protein
MDSGDLTTPITNQIVEVAWPAVSSTYVVTNTNHGIASGKKYRFISKAHNAHGDSLPSTEIKPSVGALPGKP